MQENELGQPEEQPTGTRSAAPVPWGIYVISAFWGVVAVVLPLFLIVLPLFGGRHVPEAGWLVMVMAPLALLFCVGMALRINWVRLVLIGLLGGSLVVHAILVAWILMARGFHGLGPNATRVGLTIGMFFYLLHEPVRRAFVRKRAAEEEINEK
jgi:hypothetical protein